MLELYLNTVQKWISNTENLPLSTKKSLYLVLENHKLKERLKNVDDFIRLLKELQK